MKPITVGIGYIALGLVSIWIIGWMTKGAGITSTTCVGAMSVMVMFASYLSYDLGKKDAQKREKETKEVG